MARCSGVLGAGYHLIGEHKTVTLSGVVVTSTAEGSGKDNTSITSEDGMVEDDDDKLRVC